MDYFYQNLRDSVSNLAASAKTQSDYLTKIFTEMDGDAARFRPCNELAHELDDYFAGGVGAGASELSQQQILAIRQLDDYLRSMSGQQHVDFWERSALFSDPHWEEVRRLAQYALDLMPPVELPTRH